MSTIDNETKRRYAEVRNSRRRAKYKQSEEYRQLTLDRTKNYKKGKQRSQGKIGKKLPDFAPLPRTLMVYMNGQDIGVVEVVKAGELKELLGLSDHTFRELIKNFTIKVPCLSEFSYFKKTSTTDLYYTKSEAKALYDAVQKIYVDSSRVQVDNPQLKELYILMERCHNKDVIGAKNVNKE